MSTFSPTAPKTHRFLRLVDALVRGPNKQGSLLAINDTAAFVRLDDNTVAIIILPTKRGDELIAAIREQLSLDKKTHLKLVLVGGGDEMRAILEAAQPRILARRMVQVFALPDEGSAWAGRASRLESRFGSVVAQVAATTEDAAVTLEELSALVPKLTAEEKKAAREQVVFVKRVMGRKPWLTWSLLGFFGFIFVLEMLLGGSEYIPTLVRMGANTETALGAEPWRLLSSVSLHSGVVHIGVNGLVLYVLGGQLERILGWARTAILLVVAGLCGALASSLTSMAALSVGASGAIWGVLAAAGVIALRPGDLLPAGLASRMRRAALINLGLNLAASFLPQVDFMAHFGGGAAGALLAFAGVLTRGLAPLTSREEPKPEPRPIVFGAVAGLFALGAASVIAIVLGRPWVLVTDPQLQDVPLSDHGLVVSTPKSLGDPDRLAAEGSVSYKFGDGLSDSVTVVVDVRPHDWLDPAAEAAAFYEMEVAPFDGATPIGERLVIEDAEFPTFEERASFENGLVLLTRISLLPTSRVIVEAAYWEGATPEYKAAAAKSVASLRAQ